MPLFLMAQFSETISLNEGWQFSQVNDSVWYDADVPGSVQADLIRHNVLPDPFYGTNEKDIQWVEDEDWDYRKTFVVSANQLNHDDAYIFFEGLDTHADVFLNGSRILQTENMFIGHKVPVKNILKEGENKLYIRFYSPIKRMMPARETFGYEYPAGNDHRDEKLSVYNRKAPYHFGWDWGIRIVQMGIWKPVTLNFYDKARIDDYYVKQSSVTSEKANINNIIEIYSIENTNATIAFGYSLNDKEELKQLQSTGMEVKLQKGNNIFSLPSIIENPQLW
ncbi:MAG TPA: glycoside hydrolase family 2 protein, partial [Bacteroidales bacterium]|nr:glycoside hydrolase family 2 protein [Bacteroidales bacterium]